AHVPAFGGRANQLALRACQHDVMTATYRERPPVAGLAPAVACVWTQHVGATSAPYEHRVVPDACVDVLWRDGRLELAGPDTGPVLTPLSPQSSIVGIRFRPGHARRFLGVPVSELTDARLSLDDVLGDDARDLADRLADARTADDGERLLEAAMLERVPTAPDADDVVEPLVAMLATGRSSCTTQRGHSRSASGSSTGAASRRSATAPRR